MFVDPERFFQAFRSWRPRGVAIGYYLVCVAYGILLAYGAVPPISMPDASGCCGMPPAHYLRTLSRYPDFTYAIVSFDWWVLPGFIGLGAWLGRGRFAALRSSIGTLMFGAIAILVLEFSCLQFWLGSLMLGEHRHSHRRVLLVELPRFESTQAIVYPMMLALAVWLASLAFSAWLSPAKD